MHGHHAAEDEPMADMNLIPLIDVALTLLIILMVTSVFIHRPGVSVHLPQSATREGAPETSKDLIITVSTDGTYHVDGKLETLENIQARLVEMASRDREARVMVKGDRDVPYARMMSVMDLIRQAGLTHIVLPTDPKMAQSTALPTGATAPAPTSADDNAPPAPPGGTPVGTSGGNASTAATPPTDRPNANSVPGAAPDALSSHK